MKLRLVERTESYTEQKEKWYEPGINSLNGNANICFYSDVKLFAKAGVIEVELDVKSWFGIWCQSDKYVWSSFDVRGQYDMKLWSYIFPIYVNH